MNSKLFELDGLARAAIIEEPTILTSLGRVYTSLRRKLPDESFEEILCRPDSMFKSQVNPNVRKYLWQTDGISAELTIDKVDSKSAAVENKYMLCWRVEANDPTHVLNCRVGFEPSSHSFSYVDSIGDQWHDGAAWTNEEFIKNDTPIGVVAIAGWYDLGVMTDQRGVSAPCTLHRYTSGLSALFAIASGSVTHEDYPYPEPELAGALNERKLIWDFNRAVDPIDSIYEHRLPIVK